MLSDSFKVIWQFIVFLILLLSYPDDGCKCDQNGLVINNMIKTYFVLVQSLALFF
jgi:hypothetical protein